jgi:hypothetical protein
MIIRGCSTFAQPEFSLHVIEAEYPVGILGNGLQMAVQCRGGQEDAPREACFMASATRPAILLALS